MVGGISEGGPADRAGLKRGDILQALNGDVLDDVGDFYQAGSGRAARPARW